MKRLLGLLLLMGMVGCGGGDTSQKSSQKKIDEPPVHGSPGKNTNPFIDAVAKGDIEAVKKHLTDGADANVGNPLNVAIESRSAHRKEIIELLLAKGCDVNAKNNRGRTPAESLKGTAGVMMLVGATDEAKAANNEIAALLLQHGAQTDADFKPFFPGAVADPTAEPETPDSTPPGEEAAADP